METFTGFSADTKTVLNDHRVKFGKIEGLDQIQNDPKNISRFESFSRYGPWAELEHVKNSLINSKIPTKSLTPWNQG